MRFLLLFCIGDMINEVERRKRRMEEEQKERTVDLARAHLHPRVYKKTLGKGSRERKCHFEKVGGGGETP